MPFPIHAVRHLHLAIPTLTVYATKLCRPLNFSCEVEHKTLAAVCEMKLERARRISRLWLAAGMPFAFAGITSVSGMLRPLRCIHDPTGGHLELTLAAPSAPKRQGIRTRTI
jgi:hypothetical protein